MLLLVAQSNELQEKDFQSKSDTSSKRAWKEVILSD